MRKTFCDRHPDTECTSRVGLLNLTIIHKTNKNEVVSEDQYRPMELCGGCVDELLNSFLAGMSPLPLLKEPSYTGEDAVMANPEEQRALVTGYPVGPRDE